MDEKIIPTVAELIVKYAKLYKDEIYSDVDMLYKFLEELFNTEFFECRFEFSGCCYIW